MDEPMARRPLSLLRCALLATAGAAAAVVLGLILGAQPASADEPDVPGPVGRAAHLLHDTTHETADRLGGLLEAAPAERSGRTPAVGGLGGVAAGVAGRVDGLVGRVGTLADGVVRSAPAAAGLLGEKPVSSLLAPMRDTVGDVLGVVPAALDAVPGLLDAVPGILNPVPDAVSDAPDPATAAAPGDGPAPPPVTGTAPPVSPSLPPSPCVPGFPPAGSVPAGDASPPAGPPDAPWDATTGIPATAVSAGGSGQSSAFAATVGARATAPPGVQTSGPPPAEAAPDQPCFDSDCTPD